MFQTKAARSPRSRAFALLAALALALPALVSTVPMAAGVGSDGTGMSLSTSSSVPASAISHGSRDSRRIALTIDDGASPSICHGLLEILRRKRVPATFFPVAQYVVRAPTVWREIAAQGFPIGNHTAHHPVLTQLSYGDQYREIDQARRMIEATSGVPMIHVVRPPTGAFNTSVLRAARAAGFPILLTWDTTFADTSRTASVAKQIRYGERGRNGSVILMHCRPHTLQILEPVIDYYLARGFTFVTVPQLLGLPGPVPKFPPPAGRPAHLLGWPWDWRDYL